MIGSALIVFREVLEAALIVAIVLGATRGVANRGRWISGGIAGGLVGAVIVAIFAGAIAEAVAGRGQELLNAGILLTAVAMLIWHNVWMSAHGRELAAKMRTVGHAVSIGAKPLSALALVAMFAVLREGSETVLFLYGLASSGASWSNLLIGAPLGLAGGIAVGLLLYLGLLAIPVGQFMNVVAWMVLLLSAGLAANAALFLNQAGLIPALGLEVWDSSGILDQGSWLGELLHVLIGYTDRPMGIQLLFYGVTLGVTLALMYFVGGRSTHRLAPARVRKS